MSKNFGKTEFTITNQLIGDGSYSKVVLAIKKKSNKKIACKIINKNSLKKRTIKLIEKEAEILRKLEHPNIIKIIGKTENEFYTYIFTEYINGYELLEYLKNFDIVEPLLKHIFKQLVSAVAYLHKQGIMHRDLKLENILITNNYVIKIIDFGFADYLYKDKKPKNNRGTKTQVRFNKFCGSEFYFPPEFLSRTPYIGEPVDIWCLGIILFTLAMAEFPFYDEKRDMKQVKFPNTINKELKNLILKMLRPNPKKRIKMKKIIKSKWLS